MQGANFLDNQKTRASKRFSADGLMGFSLAVALGFCIICGAVLWQERRNVWDHAGQNASNLVAAINSDIARNIEQYDLSLQGVIEGMKLPEINQVSRRARQAILFDHSATAMFMGSIRVLDENGDVLIDSRALDPWPENFADREYFQLHRTNTDAGLHISSPFSARNGEYVIALTRRLSRPDGSFSGVVVGTLRLAYFHELFRKVAPSPRSALTLFDTDGTVVMRLPLKAEDIGRHLITARVLTLFPQVRSGRYDSVAVIDGIHRLYAFSQVDDFPLLMAVGIPVAEVYAGWYRDAVVIGLLMLALCGATIFSAVLLGRELKRRVAAEQQLEVLATTDSLTGLSNRRHFDEVIEREWQRAMREETSIAVLMIDADWFKVYNDTHGHHTGDEFLKAIGGCIANKTRRATDLAARYGGEEFAVLLPSTGAQGALEIAERIRTQVTELGLTHSAGSCATPTVSIGVACTVPLPGSDCRDLINAADKVLYEAKANGRNRTELAEIVGSISPDTRQPDIQKRLVA
jgi:diguanylate cyclase (GGDEF)-like protein